MTLSDRCPSVPNLSQTQATSLPRKRVTLEQSYSSPGNQTTTSTTNRRYHRANTSILLTRWLSSSKKTNTVDPEANQEVTWDSEDYCMDYGKAPPVEEPHCYSMCMSESSITDDNDGSFIVSRDIINGLLSEHMRLLGVRIQLIDDLENGLYNDINIFLKCLETCRSQELNVLLLYVSFLGHDNLIAYLHKAGADLNHCENERNLTALHLCAFSNSLNGVKYLLTNGATINYSKIHTPYHYAAFGNSLDVAKYFFDIGMCQDSQQNDETVLHAAARSNSYDVLNLLAPNNLSINRIDSSGYAPIHHIADGGDSLCMTILLECGANVNLLSKKGDSALHIAAEAGCTDNLELLLKNGGNSSIKNHRGQTALHLASRTHSLECIEALLRNGKINPNDIDNDGRTALHLALGRSLLTYDVTELLIDWRADVNIADKYGYTPLHVAALNELSQCVDILIQHGADLSARTKGGTTALSIILRKTPTSLSIFKQRLDSSITLHQQSSAAGEMELRLDFHPLLQHRGQGEIGYLGTFVKEGYKEVLEHPLCQSFLHLKWQKIRKYYVGRLFFYLFYVVVLTSWVMTALAHNCYNESHGQIDDSNNHPLCANSTGLKGFFHRHPEVLEIEWYALVVLTIFEGMRKATGILTYPSIRQFITQPENIVEWCVILSVFATSFVYTGRTYTWQSHVGAFAVLCGWSNLMLMIGQLPMFGAYVAMFTSVQAQVFKLLLAYACLLVGFTASFCVIFPRSKSFSSPHTGLIKVLVMMTGELDFEELFFPGEEDTGRHVDVGSTSWILLQVSAQLSFVLFLLFVTIVLMNLLVGIAVHDIKGLQKTAGLAKLVRQTKLICDVESALLLALLPHKLIKLLSWTTLVLPSPLRAILTVRPLNPREKRLPRDVLVAAHRVAKNKKFLYLNTLSSKRSSNAFTYRRKSEPPSSFRYDQFNYDHDKFIDYDYDNKAGNKLQEKIIELTDICESNRKLIDNLVKILSNDERYFFFKQEELSNNNINNINNNNNSNSFRQRNYSTSSTTTADTMKEKEVLSSRLSSIYKSARLARLHELPDKVIVTDQVESTIDMEIDAGEPPPVDESLFFDNLESLRNVDINGTTLKSAMWSVFSMTEIKKLLKMERNDFNDNFFNNNNNFDDRFKNIAYVWACFRGLDHLLTKLELHGAKIDYVEPCTGINAILAASLSGNIACLRHLIDKNIDVNYVSINNNYTPLHFAAFGNSRDAAELLLNSGAKLILNNNDVEPIIHCAIRAKSLDVVILLLERGVSVKQRNQQEQTPLHVACIVQDKACVEALLNTNGTDINAVDRSNRTPLHFAVMTNGSSSELVELLLKHPINVNAKDKVGFTPLHIAALNEQSQCVDALIWSNADISATTSTGLSALNIILRKIPESINVFRQRLDASITLKRPVPHNREFEMKLQFDLLFPSNNPCETSFINTFVIERRKDLLSHPLVMAFLHLKWEKIRKFYLMRILLYAMTVICMTTYILTALAYKCYNNSNNNSSNNDYINNNNFNIINTTTITTTIKSCGSKRITGFLFRKTVIEIEWYLSLFLTCITIPRKIFGFMVHKSAKQYFSNIDNVLDGVVILSVFMTSFIYTGRTYDWQNYVGAFAILCAWTNLMLMVGQLPAFGTYVAMFTHIQFEFAKLLLAYSGLLIGFTISFCVIFAGEPSFGNPFTGLIKVLAMMAGELDFEGLINQPDQLNDGGPFVIYHPLSVCSQILFTLFLVFVTVILMNLLVGIAVHDIQGLRNHAGLTKLVRQTKLILFTEMVLNNNAIPFAFRKWMSDHDIDMENRKRVLIVKPLNPLEKRLPKEILKAAYDIAKKNVPILNDDVVSFSEHVTWMKKQECASDYNNRDFDNTFNQFSIDIKVKQEGLRIIKEQMLDNNRMLTDILSKLNTNDNNHIV
ncbi:uncharacterized protein LOC122856501 [Aphidius gifuensis]|uniref:uncharacterized protein LOC122856501 n=1 Tax=Aphidius gifuensis TaxID=684658 RepID=UPI001CDC7B5D|nr:uncharacterized protein LOC122856501 [Aphidius gifuensis]